MPGFLSVKKKILSNIPMLWEKESQSVFKKSVRSAVCGEKVCGFRSAVCGLR